MSNKKENNAKNKNTNVKILTFKEIINFGPQPTLGDHLIILTFTIVYQLIMTYIYFPAGIPSTILIIICWFSYQKKLTSKRLKKEYDEIYKTLEIPKGRHGR